MDPALQSLVAANLAFVGTHFALSHPLRAPVVRVLGEKGFLAAYSLIAFATLGWMVFAFRAAPAADMGGASGVFGWAIATVLTLPALVLFIGSLRGNPALPGLAASAAGRAPTGVFAVTRHPMMWGFALWAIAHLAIDWSWRTTIVAATILFLALVGAHLQDRKKEALMGAAWSGWEAKTSYWPRLAALPRAGRILWLVATGLWLAVTWAHIGGVGVPAGVWRWVS